MWLTVVLDDLVENESGLVTKGPAFDYGIIGSVFLCATSACTTGLDSTYTQRYKHAIRELQMQAFALFEANPLVDNVQLAFAERLKLPALICLDDDLVVTHYQALIEFVLCIQQSSIEKDY